MDKKQNGDQEKSRLGRGADQFEEAEVTLQHLGKDMGKEEKKSHINSSGWSSEI